MARDPLPDAEIVPLMEQIISAVIVTQLVTVNTLHAQAVIDRRHVAHAIARAIDALAGDPRNSLLVSILQVIKNAHMQTGQGEQPDIQAWIRTLLDKGLPPDDDAGER